jgi:hypothetical protein
MSHRIPLVLVGAGCPPEPAKKVTHTLPHRLAKRALPTRSESGPGLGCVKTKSDLVVMPSGRQIFPFFALRITTEPKIPGAVIPRRVFTQPGSGADITYLLSNVRFTPEARTSSDTTSMSALCQEET